MSYVYWFSFVCKLLQPDMLPGKKLCCDSDWVSAIFCVTCMQSKRICVFQGLQYYTTMLLCVSGCTPQCCVFHHRVAVCFRVYTMLCVSERTPPCCCVFQGVHHHVVVCFRVYTTMLCVSECTLPYWCVFQGVHHHVVYFRVDITILLCVSGCTPPCWARRPVWPHWRKSYADTRWVVTDAGLLLTPWPYCR